MKYATQLALASVASCALSAQASSVTTFAIDFDDYTLNATPSGAVTNGTWSGDAGAGSYVDTKRGSDRNLVLDAASDDPLVFTPTATNTASISMDVKFVAASTAQGPVADSQVGLYVLKKETTTNLMVFVKGAADFVDSGIDVEEDHWYTVKLTFDYTAGSKTVALSIYDVENSNTQVGSTYTANSATTATKLNFIDFYGSGCVDNFVGSPATEYASITTSTQVGKGSSDEATIDATLVNGKLKTSFAATSENNDALKFITVSGTINGHSASRTLRVVNGQVINIDGCGFTAISGVTAYYGDVTATTDAEPAITPTVANGQVSLSVTPKSGLYYSVDVNGERTPLNNNIPIAPEAEGTTLDYTIDAANPAQGYGVKKFKVIASDDPVPAPAP